MEVKNIYLADDDWDDVELFQEALEEICEACTLTSSKDGIDLLNKLSSSSCPLPEVMFIDVNMPIMDGLDCLEQIRSQSSLRDIPVIILTTSASPITVERAYKLGANMFVVKPTDYNELKDMLCKVIMMDWANAAPYEFVYKAS